MGSQSSAELKAQRPSIDRYGVTFQVIPQGPYDSETPLQICCFPDHTFNAIMKEGGGTYQLNEHFGGDLSKLRDDDHFRGFFLETIQIIPTKNQIKAERLLLIGLGDPSLIDDYRLQLIGRLVINEAHKQNVTGCMFAPNIKDAGIENLPTERVTKNICLGMLHALSFAGILENNGLLRAPALKDVTMLAGPQFVDDTWAAVTKAFESEAQDEVPDAHRSRRVPSSPSAGKSSSDNAAASSGQTQSASASA